MSFCLVIRPSIHPLRRSVRFLSASFCLHSSLTSYATLLFISLNHIFGPAPPPLPLHLLPLPYYLLLLLPISPLQSNQTSILQVRLQKRARSYPSISHPTHTQSGCSVDVSWLSTQRARVQAPSASMKYTFPKKLRGQITLTRSTKLSYDILR